MEVPEWLERRVTVVNECWLWRGYLYNGYGRIKTTGNVRLMAHRWVYEKLVGPIPTGLVIDHLCHVRNCVRVDHLQPVTARVNAQRVEHTNVKNFCEHNKQIASCLPCRNARYASFRYAVDLGRPLVTA